MFGLILERWSPMVAIGVRIGLFTGLCIGRQLILLLLNSLRETAIASIASLASLTSSTSWAAIRDSRYAKQPFNDVLTFWCYSVLTLFWVLIAGVGGNRHNSRLYRFLVLNLQFIFPIPNSFIIFLMHYLLFNCCLSKP